MATRARVEGTVRQLAIDKLAAELGGTTSLQVVPLAEEV